MTNAVANTATNGLAVLSSIRTGLAQVRASIPASVGGQALLRMLKDGSWVMGREDNEVKAGTEAIVNPLSFMSGYSCWTNRQPGQGKNENLGEEMWGIGASVPPVSALPQHHDPRTQELCSWRSQMSVEMKLIDGPFSGQQVMYKASSVGGTRALGDMLDAIMARIDSGTEYACPIIAIQSDHYNHNSYGKTYTPNLSIVGWANIQGKEEADTGAPAAVDEVIEPPKPEPVAEAPAGRRRRI